MGVIMHNNISYGGGSSIEPNPQESATEQLETLGIDGDVYDVTDANAAREVQETITEAQSRANLADGDSVPTIFGKIKKWFSDLKTVAFRVAYSDLSGTPTIPTVNDGTLTIQKNGTNVQTFSANQSANATANIECATPSDVEGSKVVTGNPLTITDAAGIKAEKIEIGFEPKQDLHGYDKPWVGGAGKNKLILTSAKIKQRNTSGTWTNNSYAWNGVTYALTVDSQDNVTNIALSGTRSGESFLYLANQDDIYTYSKSIAGNQMTLNGCPANGGSDKYYLSTWISGSGTKSDYGSGVNATYPASFTQCNITLGVASGYAISGTLNFRPMLRLATVTDSSFAPYKNECPITGLSEVSGVTCAVNQWDEQWEVGGYDSTTGEKNNVTTKIRNKNPIDVHAYDEFYVYLPSNLTDDIQVYYYDKNMNFMGRTSWLYKGVCSKLLDAYYMNFLMADVYGTTYSNDISINYPSTDHDYHAYQSHTTTIQLGQTLYGGKLTILQDGSANVYCDTAYNEYDGSSDEDWHFENAAAGKNFWIPEPIFKKPCYGNDLICNMALSTSSAGTEKDKVFVSNGGNLNVTFGDTLNISTAADFKTWLASHVLQVAGTIATPFTIHLSHVETLTLLQGINNVWTDGTTLNLTYQPDNAIGQAKGTAQEAMMSTIWTSIGVFSQGDTPVIPQCKELLLISISQDEAEYYDGQVYPYALYGLKYLYARPLNTSYVCVLKPDGSVIAGGTYKLAIFYR